MPSQKLLDELQVIYHRNRQRAIRERLFVADATCHVCTAEIQDIEDCGPVKMATGEEFLIHNACSREMYQRMAARYFGRVRFE